jgi:hypothetical protein
VFKIVVPLALLGAYLYNKGMGAKQLEYEVVGVQVQKFTLPANLDLRVSVRFLNASSQDFKVDSIRLNIKESGSLLGDCYANTPFTIAAGTQTTVPFPVSVRTGAVLLRLVPLLAKGQGLPALDVSGFLTVEGVEKALTDIQVPLAPYDPRRPATPVTTKVQPKKATPQLAPKPAPKPAPKAPAPAAPKKAAPGKPAPKAPAKKAVAPKKTSTSAPRR